MYAEAATERTRDALSETAKQFAIHPIDSLALPNGSGSIAPSTLKRCGVWGFKGPSVVEDLQRTICLLGFKPSSSLHLGHLSALAEAKLWIDSGARLTVMIGETEAVLRGVPPAEIAANVSSALELIARYFGESSRVKVVRDAVDTTFVALDRSVSRVLRTAKVDQVLGKAASAYVSNYRIATGMVTTFLYESREAQSVVVPLGMNEAPFAELAKIAARSLRVREPTSTYRGLISDITGQRRMRSDRPDLAIRTVDSVPELEAKLRVSKTGGRRSDEHSRLGGRPLECVFLSIANALVESTEVDRAMDLCLGGRACTVCKADLIPCALAAWKEKRRSWSL